MLSRFPRLKMLLPLLLVFFATLVILRAGFYFWFLDESLEPSTDVLLKAFWIGVRFDLRVAVLMLLPLALMSWLPRWLSLRGPFGYSLALTYMAIAVATVTLFYVADFAHYAYLDERLNASVLRFAEDGMDSVQMVWESYPVIWLLLLLFTVTAFFTWLVRSHVDRFRAIHVDASWMLHLGVGIVVLPLFVFAVMGKVGSTVPLRWSDAFFSGNPEVSAVGLNPVLFFFDTLQNQTREYDEKLLAEHYDSVAAYLGVDNPDVQTFNFSRQIAGRAGVTRPPNVVFIHLESLGANRTGLFGNPTGATPHIDQAGREGLFFPNFMVPSSGTARTVFGLITSIPDVTWGGSTATRNPLIANQYSLVNAFKGYQRLYFIGGSAGWANIKGLLESSIDDLELWEEGHYDAPNIDVWGISDWNLFKAAHKRLAELPPTQPFVAFIQLAGNHRPFTIPDEGSGFEIRDVPDADVQQHGFLAADQFNAVRLLDFNVGYYLNDLVKQSHYADNTIFVLYGDHNDRSTPTEHMGYSEDLFLYKHHVPLIIYAPGLIDTPQVIERPASLVDVLPTALGLAGLPYENRTMGRDLLNTESDSFALTFGGDRTNRPTIGLLGADYWMGMFHDGEEPALHPLENASLENRITDADDPAFRRYQEMLTGIYQASRYMLHHNRRDKVTQP